MGKFKLCDALRLIGELSHQIHTSKKESYVIQGVTISNSVLAYLSMQLIESSNDYRRKDMALDDLLKAIDMYFGLPDPFQENSENYQGFLIRFGATQFDYDREARHLLPRTLIIYRDLWTKIEGVNQVDIDGAIKSFSGLNIQEILVLSMAFTGGAKKGFFRLYENTHKYPDTVKEYFDYDKQNTFVNWISCTYNEFRSLSRLDAPSSTEYEKFRFNPLWNKPVIIPDRNVKQGFPQVYITPIPTLVYERVARGLYFNLADYFKDGRRNSFREAFGHVFQEYVGLLLKNAFGELNVQQEWKYGSKKYSKDTPDWLVIQNGVAVLIEVKQSGLYLVAKKWGDLGEIQKDLMKTIGAGVSQMWEFENDINSGLCTLPDCLCGIEITERVVVTYDRSYFLNSVLRDEIKQLSSAIPETYHWHTISVEELEYFLGIVGINFIDALKEKRLDLEGDRMDFRDYYSRRHSQDDWKNPYLDSIYDSFFGEIGLQPISTRR